MIKSNITNVDVLEASLRAETGVYAIVTNNYFYFKRRGKEYYLINWKEEKLKE